MTTSGVTAWSLTARDIVTEAMKELGVLNPGEEPEASEMDDSILRLNGMLKSWQAKANLFREETATITTTAATALVTLAAGIRDISSARYVVSATSERLLFPMGRTDYLSLPNKAQAGAPTMYYFSRTIGAAELYLWPVSATAASIKLDYSREAETVTDPSQTLDIPELWHETVVLGLASRIANMFGTTRLDPATVARIEGRADALYTQMLDHDRPDSYRFESESEYC